MIAITPFGKPSIIALRRKEENKKVTNANLFTHFYLKNVNKVLL